MNRKLAITLIVAGFAGMMIVEDPSSYQSMHVTPKQDPVTLTPREATLAEYFQKVGSDQPVRVAKAVAKTKRPRLIGALIAQESSARSSAVGKIGELGLGQIRAELHGPVPPPEQVEAQVIQVEELLEQMLQANKGKITPALSAWNGDRTGRYAMAVRRRIQEIRI